MDALHNMSGVVHDLLRDAAHVDAGAAERALLADGDLGACGATGLSRRWRRKLCVDAAFRTMRRRAARRGDAARAGADDQVVEVPASVATGEFAVAATA